MSKEAELSIKRTRVAELLDRLRLAGLLLGRNSSVSWALAGGEAHTIMGSELSSAAVLYTPRRDFLLASQSDMPRLLADEMPGTPFEPLTLPWHEPGERAALIAELTESSTVAGDVPIAGVQPLPEAIAALRYQLTPEEQSRLHDLGARAGMAMETAAGEIAPGMSEYAIAGLLAEECFLRDITPIRLLVATDERARRFRQPIPTSKQLERYAVLMLSARHRGLTVNLTRLVHFGPIPTDLRKRVEACARIDAAAIAACRPGAQASDIFARMEAAYAAERYTDEWHHHHQGGATGYEIREWLAMPTSAHVVHEHQAFTWNPSITGTQIEDTLLVQAQGAEMLTHTPHWPVLSMQVDNMTIQRPTILEVE